MITELNKDIVNGKQYRLIEKENIIYDLDDFIYYYEKSYKVQIKIWFIWVTIKCFNLDEFYNDIKFCKLEAKELYNKIVNPYGRFQ